MTSKEAFAFCRLNSLGCWWPSRAYPKHVQWDCVAAELGVAIEHEVSVDRLSKLREARVFAIERNRIVLSESA